ncbi:MAG: hypothetical protein ACEROO_12020, partial [Candidatus Bathyarchaeota archaeon]
MGNDLINLDDPELFVHGSSKSPEGVCCCNDLSTFGLDSLTSPEFHLSTTDSTVIEGIKRELKLTQVYMTIQDG